MKPIEDRIKEYRKDALRAARYNDFERWIQTVPRPNYDFYSDILKELASRQARIDMLMNEYCPDEMTPEQIEEWSKHQVKADGITDDTVAIQAILDKRQ